MKTAFVAVLTFVAMVGLASAGRPGCCGPKQLDQLTVGLASVTQNPAKGELQGSVNMMMYFDYRAEVAAMYLGNFSENLEVYVQGGDIQRQFVYLPKYNLCVNITYDPTILQQKQLCVGAGSDHPNFAAAVDLGHAVVTESWGDANRQQFVNVNPNGCVLTAVNQWGLPASQGGTMLGIYYNISATVANDAVFNPPTACMKSETALEDFASHHPRKLQEMSAVLEAGLNSANKFIKTHQSI